MKGAEQAAFFSSNGLGLAFLFIFCAIPWRAFGKSFLTASAFFNLSFYFGSVRRVAKHLSQRTNVFKCHF